MAVITQLADEDDDKQKARTFTRQYIWEHPNLIVIESNVYDLTQFAQRHPGGAGPLLSAGGTDVTSLFHSMHRRTEKDRARYFQVLSEFQVGQVAGEDSKDAPSMQYDSEFAKELYEQVCQTLPQSEWWAPAQFWARTAFICIGTILCELAWVFTGRWEACVLTGIFHAQIGLAVQHDASHGAISKDGRVNAFFAYGADWIGNSKPLWFQQHIIAHHPNTNDAEADPDTTSAEPFLLFRTVDASLRKFYHQFQHWLMYPVLSLYGPSVVYNFPQLFTLNHGNELPVNKNEFIQRQILPSVALRVLYYARVVVAPYYIGQAPIWLCLFGVNLVTGFCLTFVFVLSHNFVGSDRFPLSRTNDSGEIDWYKMQVETSCTYGGMISGLLTGGLNFQIEHHLFPRMCSAHYPTIAPIVRRVCAKYNVRYTYFPSIWQNMRSTVRFMKLNGMSKLRMD